MRKDKHLTAGITLVALVVTILVLIILATISINIIFGEEGILERAIEGQEKQKKAEAREKVQMMITDYLVEREISKEEYKLITYMNKQVEKGNLDSAKEETRDEKEKVIVETNGYEIEIDVESLEVTVAGEGITTQKPENTTVAVTGVTLNKESTTLKIGETETLTATVEPSNANNKEVEWTSSKEEIATVDGNGKVTALAVGSTVITVTAKDGSGVKGTCVVNVTEKAAGTPIEKPKKWTNTNVTAIADGSGNAIPLPNGYYYIGGNKAEGLVISDKQGDSMTAEGTASGNQFVWIPVTESEFYTTNFDSNGKTTTDAPALGLNITECSEPYTSGYSDGKGTEETKEYNTMKTQVLLYGGFYIGRYEAGINSTTLRTSATTAQEVVVKKGVAPYNYVPWGASMSNAGEVSGKSGAVYLVQNKYTIPTLAQNAVTSTLCYGVQWDAMCRYVGDSHRTSNKTGFYPTLTGNANDVSKNIYDLAGNCREWTMEAYSSSSRVLRGFNYNGGKPVSYRDNGTLTGSSVGYSFRIALYIK